MVPEAANKHWELRQYIQLKFLFEYYKLPLSHLILAHQYQHLY